MKKILLSLFVMLSFGGYALYSKNAAEAEAKNIPVASIADSALPTGSAAVPAPAQPAYSVSRRHDDDDDDDDRPIRKPATIPAVQPATIPTPTNNVPTPSQAPVATGQYKDGSYTGNSADAYYGYVQVQAIIKGGKIADVKVLQSPNDRSTSIRINSQAMPYLVQEAIQVQNAKVNVVSGATDSSYAFQESLGTALAIAQR
jgi:uncharacterized protein with FMN-binding domain